MVKINQAADVCLGAFDFTDALIGSGLPSQSPIIMRKLPSPGFQVEVVLVDYDGSLPQRAPRPTTNTESNESPTATASRETSASKTSLLAQMRMVSSLTVIVNP
ncbi:phosphatidylinositol 3,4,5-trisphosphate 3-phosphatase and protein-tyrosine-phosphatase PTEN2A [Iris pallida]|uniref:Phosphatidylinositol 3,4,5-trisphosphate 3-phosphatase and protein-tyrosine-phosphatase PTEN2A n=1 Tax=Iris pallida TaxID=29817 RepID=A0AAX6ELU3_IRIPA|nr:phosphatidylinositol 3,4,5-trisphosphate 3-phosphatase and protein-tyrosine-phosphatase PTEN2A [Iris pallida]